MTHDRDFLRVRHLPPPDAPDDGPVRFARGALLAIVAGLLFWAVAAWLAYVTLVQP